MADYMADLEEDRMDETVHAAPMPGSGRTPCCDLPPFELEHTDRITRDPTLVTCPERAHQLIIGTAREDIPAGAPVVLEIDRRSGHTLVSIRR